MRFIVKCILLCTCITQITTYILSFLTFPIELPPYIIPTNGEFTLGVTRNNSINILVDLTAIDPVNSFAIQWYFNSTLIEEDNKSNKYIFCCGGQSLTFLYVQHSDAGIYEIKAGSFFVNITLNVYGMFFNL